MCPIPIVTGCALPDLFEGWRMLKAGNAIYKPTADAQLSRSGV
jgi:hypothetical protein